jgi:hypothetical protein
VPTNRPAIGDMFDYFDFGQHDHGEARAASAPARLPRLRGGQGTGRQLWHEPNALR